MPFERIWISMVGLFCSFAVRNEVTYAARIHTQSKWFWNGFRHVSPERTNICARHRDNTLADILLTKFLREFRKWENELGRGWRWGVGRWWGLGVCGGGGVDEKWLEMVRNSSKHCCSSQSTTNVHRNHQSGFIEAISPSSLGPAEPNDCNASSHFSVLLWKIILWLFSTRFHFKVLTPIFIVVHFASTHHIRLDGMLATRWQKRVSARFHRKVFEAKRISR